MRRNIALALAGVACSLVGGPAIGGSPRAVPMPRDPLLKRSFDPKAFERAPVDLTDRCPDLVNKRYSARLWVFARAVAPDGERLVVAGLLLPRRAGDRALVNDQGAVVRLGATDCALLGPAAEPFADPDAYADTIPGPLLAVLTTDAARRYRAAYGQKRLRAGARASRGLGDGLRRAFTSAAR